MTQATYTYKTIEHPSESEFKDRGSRFIAYVFPVRNLEEIKAQIKSLKELHPKAVHHCFAWRLGTDMHQYRSSDDGEPSGSAGKPILGQIDSFGLTYTLIVVVRYFGGTLLGVPGLIHAYKTSAHMALEQNTIVEKNIEIPYLLEFDYTQMNDVMRLIKQYNIHIIRQDLQLFCQFEISISLAELEKVLDKFNDLREVKISAK